MGIVPATLFLVLNLTGILFLKYYNEKFLFEHTSGLLSICFTVFLVLIPNNLLIFITLCYTLLNYD